MYTMKDICKKLNFSEYTIRFYADKGLIPNLERDKNNKRVFSQESVQWLTAIKQLRGCGMSLEAIKEYFELCLEGNTTIERRYEIIMKQKEIVDRKFEEIKEMSEFINYKSKLYKDLMDNKIPDNSNPLEWNL